MASSHRVSEGEIIPVRISRMKVRHCQWLGLCLFPPCYFIFLDPVKCVAFLSFSFCVLSFHNRLDLIRELAFYWVFCFIFPIYPCLFHNM